MKTENIVTFAAMTLFAAPAFAQNPYIQPDDTWISINGKIASVSADEFELDYGDGIVTVEMDDGDRDADGYKLLKGDKVRVSGVIDDDFYEETSIEAASVYVKNIDTYFFASAVDEEEVGYFVVSPVVTDTVIRGVISSVDVVEQEFTLDSGLKQITVEVDEFLYNPLDDKGFQQLEVGDTVSVEGNIDHDLFEGQVFEADSVTKLVDASVIASEEGHKGTKHPAHEMGEAADVDRTKQLSEDYRDNLEQARDTEGVPHPAHKMGRENTHIGTKHPAHEMGDAVTSKNYDKEKNVSEEYKENLDEAEHSKGTKHPAHDMGEGEEMLDKRGNL